MIKTSSDASGTPVTKFTVNGDGDMATTAATVATTATSGSIKTAGGLGIAKQAYVSAETPDFILICPEEDAAITAMFPPCIFPFDPLI